MRTINFKTKLALTASLLLLLTVAIGLQGVNNTRQVKIRMNAMYQDHLLPIGLLSQMQNLYSTEIFLLSQRPLSGEVSFPTGARQLERAEEELKEHWDSFQETDWTSQELEFGAELDALRASAEDELFEMRTFLTLSDTARYAQSRQTYMARSVDLTSALGKMIDWQVRRANELSIDTDLMNERASRSTFIIVLLGAALVIFLTIWTFRSVSLPLVKGRELLRKVSQGDFSATADNFSDDELGEMLQDVNHMVGKLRASADLAKRLSKGDLTMISELEQSEVEGDLGSALKTMATSLNNIVENIINGTGSIADASEQISAAAQQLSHGASEQAASTEMVTSSMEEMSHSVSSNAENSRQAEKMVTRAAASIQESSKLVSQTLTAMKEIAVKVSVINEITNKTDILSLNAAVEAARAGEHGKGFAVVAQEVRKLAENTKKAAVEIEKLIANSLRIAENSNQLQNEIVPHILRASELVQEISQSSVNQNQVTGQVKSSIMQLNEITQINAASSEEMATSAEQLSSQAQQLSEMVSFFRTEFKPSRVISNKGVVHFGSLSPDGKGFELDMKQENPTEDFYEKF